MWDQQQQQRWQGGNWCRLTDRLIHTLLLGDEDPVGNELGDLVDVLHSGVGGVVFVWLNDCSSVVIWKGGRI